MDVLESGKLVVEAICPEGGKGAGIEERNSSSWSLVIRV